jgi:hypothetical protein
MKLRDRTIVMVIGAVCVGFTLDAKAVGYVDTVDLGALPSSTTSIQLFNSFLNIPYASAQYSSTPQNNGYSYTGTGPVIGGTVTGSAGAPPTFIYEFSSNSQILISGKVDGPNVNFGSASLYSGTPTGASSLLATGQFNCDCGGPGTTGANWLSLGGGGGPGSYFIKLSDPYLPFWVNPVFPSLPPAGHAVYPGGDGFSIQLSPLAAPEIDSSSEVSGLTLLLGTLAVLVSRTKESLRPT